VYRQTQALVRYFVSAAARSHSQNYITVTN